MLELLDKAKEELKRADHLIFVSLKYTRTVDVIRSIIIRLINSIDEAVYGALKKAEEAGKIDEVPSNIGIRLTRAKELYPGQGTSDMLEFYNHLKKLSRAKYDKIKEYRRHVTMIASTDTGVVNVDIDTIKSYYDKVQKLITSFEVLIGGEKEE